MDCGSVLRGLGQCTGWNQRRADSARRKVAEPTFRTQRPSGCTNLKLELKPAIYFRSLGFVFGTLAHGHQENGALAFGVRREKADYVVVVEGEAGSAQALGIGR